MRPPVIIILYRGKEYKISDLVKLTGFTKCMIYRYRADGYLKEMLDQTLGRNKKWVTTASKT